MFFGSYSHSLDQKGRLVIPSRIRDEAGDRIFIMKGYDGALSCFKSSDFLLQAEEIKKLPFNQRDSRDVTRVMMSTVFELEVDKQGRIQIPSKLLELNGIGKDVVVVGVIDHFEIWDEKSWAKYQEEGDKSYEQKAESLPTNK